MTNSSPGQYNGGAAILHPGQGPTETLQARRLMITLARRSNGIRVVPIRRIRGACGGLSTEAKGIAFGQHGLHIHGHYQHIVQLAVTILHLVLE